MRYVIYSVKWPQSHRYKQCTLLSFPANSLRTVCFSTFQLQNISLSSEALALPFTIPSDGIVVYVLGVQFLRSLPSAMILVSQSIVLIRDR